MLVFLTTVASSLVLFECLVFVRRHGRLGVKADAVYRSAPPNLSLKRTRVRRASCGARRHGPLSLVR